MWSPTIFSAPWAWTKQQDTYTHITYDSNKYFHFPWICSDYEGSQRREDVVTILILSATVRFYFYTSLCVAKKSVTKIEKVTQTKCNKTKDEEEEEEEEKDTSVQWRQKANDTEQ